MRLLIHLASLVIAAGVAVHEWRYHETHQRAGVSGILTLLAIAVALNSAALVKDTYDRMEAEAAKLLDAQWKWREQRAEEDDDDAR
jgi:hypothetical protein